MENKNEKSLRTVSNSWFSKIKDFLKKLFLKSKNVEYLSNADDNISNSNLKNNWRNDFLDDNSRKMNEITKIQSLYRKGKLKEEKLSEVEKEKLCLLYDNQIEKLKKENAILQAKLLESSELYNIELKFENGEISEEDLSIEQIKSLSLLYDKKIENLERVNENRKQKLLELRNKCNQ